VLLVNGFGVDATAWRRQVAALSASHTVITYEHRGIGRSWPIREPNVTVAQLADDARALLEHERRLPAVVVGSSMGAVVALELALTHPEAVRGLVLLSPIVERDGRFEAVLRAWREHDAPASEARIHAMLPWLLGRASLAHAGRREATAAAWRAMAARTPPDALRHHADALLAWLGTRTGDLGHIRAPVMVLVGDDDVLTPPRQAEIAARGLGGRLEVIENAGHALMIERADAVNELVLDFSSRLPSAPA
jgi:pimeloyl-ACP methyl ester carboxylesterase